MREKIEMSEQARQAQREYLKNWRKENADHVREYQRKWREENRNKVRGYAVSRFERLATAT